ncbi:MAG: hypothetical protein J6T10_06585 [Methanobrevibacter sp.]|nr:hypothetical protein [Methanobrevibacter sp.]
MQIDYKQMTEFIDYAIKLGCTVTHFGKNTNQITFDNSYLFENDNTLNNYRLGFYKLKTDEVLWWEQRYTVDYRYFNNNTFDLEYMKQHIKEIVDSIKISKRMYEIERKKKEISEDFIEDKFQLGED